LAVILLLIAMRNSSLRGLIRYKKFTTDNDFFGITHITSKDIAGAFRSSSKLPSEKIAEKYSPLKVSREYYENVEIDEDMVFGKIRYDDDNIPKNHGQYEPTNTRLKFKTSDIKQLFVPEEFGQRERESGELIIEDSPVVKVDHPDYNEPYRIAEVPASYSFEEAIRLFATQEQLECVVSPNQPPLTFNFNFQIRTENSDEKESPITIDNNSDDGLKSKLGSRLSEDSELEECVTQSVGTIDSGPTIDYTPENDPTLIEEPEPGTEEFFEQMDKVGKELVFDDSLEKKYSYDSKKESSHLRADDYVQQIRTGKLEPAAKSLKDRLKNDMPSYQALSYRFDSKGFRVYDSQVPDWTKMRHVEILDYLKKSIVYHNYDIIAVNKPYGLASHSEQVDRSSPDMNRLMQEIAEQMKIKQVYLSHRLDKTTTGVLLFATSQERARNLNKLFKSGDIKKTYWCITTRVPELPAAIIDIPIHFYTVAGKIRSCLVPDKKSERLQLSKNHLEARRAITEYRILNVNSNAALVEAKPRTGVKHQIRCHMSFGLGTPILGDHKYSHVERVAPQKLSSALLKALSLRQAKVRTLPLHLHAQRVVIPGAKANGEPLFINAPLPEHFEQNMKLLKLSVNPR